MASVNTYVKCFLRSILAGICISIGCCVYIGCEVKWVGAVLFSVGLFTVITFGFDLYTGKIGYVLDRDKEFRAKIPVIILGNFVGCLACGLMMPLDGAVAIADAKLADPDYLRVLFKGLFCGILMFIAVDYHKMKKSTLAVFFCVPVFILAGFEHSIADMFYFCSAGSFSLESLLFIVVVLIGNAIGGVLIPLFRRYMIDDEKSEEKKEKEEEPAKE
ncbi:MAG: formate/nitrite transporter family protein [Candidatus Methanomethylophilaceae archaeon]|nr:formate/nitrite transporter family protein [Candidatus Methanomethylophilaceae archaeon]